MCGDHAVEHVQGFIFWDQTLRLGQYSALCASFPYKGGVYNGAQLANFPRWRVIFPVPLGPTADFDLPSTHRLPPMWGGTWYSLWQQRAPEEDWTNTAPSVRASHTRGGQKTGGSWQNSHAGAWFSYAQSRSTSPSCLHRATSKRPVKDLLHRQHLQMATPDGHPHASLLRYASTYAKKGRSRLTNLPENPPRLSPGCT